ncbi:hypothetical protein Tco_0231963 [Tanacetum coccineum]
MQDESSMPGNDTDAEDADIRPIYDEEPMTKVQLTIKCNIFATGQQHTEQPQFNNEGRVDQYPEKSQVKTPMLDSSLDNMTTEFLNQSLESENIWQHDQILNETSNKAKMKKEIDAFETINSELEHSVAKLLTVNEHLNKENETWKKHYKDISDLGKVLGKLVLQTLKNQSVVRQPIAFKSERSKISNTRFASQVDAENNLSKPVTQHYLPKGREYVYAKPHHVIASSESWNRSKNMPRFGLNDVVHNHYLVKAKKKTQERDKNSKTNVMPYARFQSTTDGSKPKPRSTNQSTRSLPISKSRHRFSSNKSSAVYEKTSYRYDLSKADSESTHGSNVDISKIHKSAGISIDIQKEQSFDLNAELESLFSPVFDEYFNGENQVVSKYFAVTIADASDKR